MKYFILGDIHSCYDAFLFSLKEAGYEKDNENHCLILLGDIFDRGNGTIKILNYIRSIPKERRILIRGNHEYLLKHLLHKEYPESYDFANGTVRTCYDLYMHRHPRSKIRKELINVFKLEFGVTNDESALFFLGDIYPKYFNIVASEYFCLPEVWNKITKDLLESDLIDWIFGDEWVDYYELDKYIFVHSFIPFEKMVSTYFDDRYYPLPNWREIKDLGVWEQASWECPYILFETGVFNIEKNQGKVLVCGHWHASDFHRHYKDILIDDEFKTLSDFAYIGENLIELDACTILSGFCNVMVIDDTDFSTQIYPDIKKQVIIETTTAKGIDR